MKNYVKNVYEMYFYQNFIETCTMHPKSRVYMGSDTENVINNLFIHFYKIFNLYQKHQMKEDANLFLKVLNYQSMNFIK